MHHYPQVELQRSIGVEKEPRNPTRARPLTNPPLPSPPLRPDNASRDFRAAFVVKLESLRLERDYREREENEDY